ncbi:MAG: SDR family oxidoreductase [Rhodospirillales bacterium]|nr:SDR family oxidoreductase [Rhodospirillales bacterium]
MDMGIRGRKAIVCASSKGLGRACAEALAAEGCDVVINGRTEETVAATATAIRTASPDVTISEVACDVTNAEGQAELLAACPQPDIFVNNAGGPPPGNFRDWDRDDWVKALDANMLTAIMLIKATVDGMIDRRFGRIVNITSAAVKSPIPILGLSNGARAGLTGFCAGLARETVEHNVTINGLLPGPFNTDRLKQTMVGRQQGDETMEDTMKREAQGNPAKRFGEPDEFGAACAFLCSQHAGFITGQNLVMDGGSFRGTL